MQFSQLQHHLTDTVSTLADHYYLPGAAAALYHDGALLNTAVGHADPQLATPLHPRSVFQLGSISKTFTATCILALIDAGRLSLDDPVAPLLARRDPDLPADLDGVTVRHLLAHSAGLDGEVFGPSPTLDHAVHSWLRSPGEPIAIAPPGEFFSYASAGFLLLAQLAEIATDMPWHAALTRTITGPLHLHGTAPSIDRIPAPDRVIGTILDRAGRRSVVPRHLHVDPALSPSAGVCATVADLARFGQHLLSIPPPGARLLSSSARRLLSQPQAAVHHRTFADAFGLGWAIAQRDNITFLFSAGWSYGQGTSLHIAPHHNLVLASGANDSRHALAFGRALWSSIRAELLASRQPDPTPVPADAGSLPDTLRRTCTGTFRRRDVLIHVEPGDENLHLSTRSITGRPPSIHSVHRANMVPLLSGGFLATPNNGDTTFPVYFSGDDDRAHYLHMDLRGAVRVDDGHWRSPHGDSP